MNIITLLEFVSLDKSKIGSFSREEYTQIKKQLVAQKENDFGILAVPTRRQFLMSI